MVRARAACRQRLVWQEVIRSRKRLSLTEALRSPHGKANFRGCGSLPTSRFLPSNLPTGRFQPPTTSLPSSQLFPSILPGNFAGEIRESLVSDGVVVGQVVDAVRNRLPQRGLLEVMNTDLFGFSPRVHSRPGFLKSPINSFFSCRGARLGVGLQTRLDERRGH